MQNRIWFALAVLLGLRDYAKPYVLIKFHSLSILLIYIDRGSM